MENITEELHEESDEDDNDMNGNVLNETEVLIDNEESKTIKIPKLTVQDIKPGLSFSSKQVAVLSIKRVFAKDFHPIVKVSGPSEKSEDFDDNGSKEPVMLQHNKLLDYCIQCDTLLVELTSIDSLCPACRNDATYPGLG